MTYLWGLERFRRRWNLQHPDAVLWCQLLSQRLNDVVRVIEGYRYVSEWSVLGSDPPVS